MSPEYRPPLSRPLGRLFPPLSPEATAALGAYPAALRRALPLRPGMERELPRQIRFLSQSLTSEREGGPKPGYLSDPRILSAYAWYFLPWNLLRLSRLLPALDLDLPEDGLVCDLGAGPLTFVQALWLSRPDLRQKKLRFLCVDRSRRALDLGLELFTALAGFDPTAPAGEDAPWRIRVLRGEYWQGLMDGADLVTMVNVANELAGTSREPLDLRMERLAAQLAESLAPGGRALVIEPGTRLGWRCLLGMRQAFTEMGLALCAPCPHGKDCPLTEGRTRAWCHFNMSLSGAPLWLSKLSERAELAKERLSLSFLMARKSAPAFPKSAVRVVSGAFSLGDAPGTAVYGCSEKGLLVLVAPDCRPPRPGDLLEVAVPADAPRDIKSGAPRVRLSGEPAGADQPTDSRPGRDAADRRKPATRSNRSDSGREGDGKPRAPRPSRPSRSSGSSGPPGSSRPARPSGPAKPGQGPARSGKGPRKEGPKRSPARPAGQRKAGNGRPKSR